jgi:hypothetical protein
MRAVPKPLFLLLVAALLVVAGFLWLDLVQKMRHPSPVPIPKGRPFPNAIMWGDRSFSSRKELARWLHSRGASYSHWRERFPSEAAVLEHRHRLSTASPSVLQAAAIARARRHADSAKTKKAATRATKTKRTAAPPSIGTRRDVLLWTAIVAALGALVVMFARMFRLR